MSSFSIPQTYSNELSRSFLGTSTNSRLSMTMIRSG